MGKRFGNLAHVNRMVYFGLSPFEQKAFPKGFLMSSTLNVFRRMSSQFLKVVPPIAISIYFIQWSKNENLRLSRKNPKDYENDE